MKRFARTGVVAAAVSIALVMTACTGSGGTSSSTATSITIGNVLGPATFEARNMNWGNQSIYAQAVYDSLVRPNPDGANVEPSLAKSWSYNDDKTVLTMKLRDDVKFTDGTKFTADVAAQNLLRFRDGTSPQRAKASLVADAKAVDPTTLQITLKYADPAFLLYLSQVAGMEESPKAYSNADVATNPVGSGPYTLDTKNSVVGSTYVFKANPNYWNKKSVSYKTFTVKILTDSTSMLNAIRGKQLNAAALADNSILPQTVQAGFKSNPVFLSMIGLYLFDRGGKLNPALGDVRVRQAINYAIDSKAFLKNIALGYGKLTQQPFRPASAGYVKSLESTYSYDPAKAKALLKEAGYENGFDLAMPTSALLSQALTALITQQLGQVGIRVTFTDVGTNLLPDMLSAKYAASYFQLQQDLVPSQLVGFMIASNATWNPFHYSTPTSDALIQRVRAGGSDGTKAAQELNKYVVDQAWFNPWYTVQTTVVTDKATSVTINQGNSIANIWDFKPAS